MHVPEEPTPRPATGEQTGWCCVLLLAAPWLLWFVGARFLPERVLWFPVWAAAVVWSGTDGHGGIGHLLG